MSSAGVRRRSSRRSRDPDPLPSQLCEDVRTETSDGGTSTWSEVKKEETLELNISHGDDLDTKPEDISIKEEDPDHKDQFYCEICKSFFFNKCEVHGSPLFIPDTPVPRGVSDRARQTLPPGLEIQESSIPDAGLGVFNKGETVPVGAHFGPYQGELVDREEAMNSEYSWVGNAGKKPNKMSEEVDPAQLVQEVEQRPLIWDITLPDYSDCYKKAKAWESIAEQLVQEWENKSVREKNGEVKKLKKRWKSLRDRFTRDMRNMNEERSGIGSTKRKKSHPLFEEMLFLKSSTEKRQTSGNVYESTSMTGSEVIYVDEGETSNPEEVQKHSTPLLRTSRKTKVKPRRAEKKGPDLDIMMVIDQMKDSIDKCRESSKMDNVSAFLKSLEGDLRQLPEDKLITAKMEIMQCVYRALYTSRQSCKQPSTSMQHTPPHLQSPTFAASSSHNTSTCYPPPPSPSVNSGISTSSHAVNSPPHTCPTTISEELASATNDVHPGLASEPYYHAL